MKWPSVRKVPLLGAVLLFGFGLGFVVAKRGMPFFAEIQQGAIGIYVSSSPVEPFTAGDYDNPVLTVDDVTDADAEFLADPFMIRVEGTWYLFFEVLNRKNDQGDLAYATSADADARRFRYQRIFLDEDVHLSYPQVFFWEGSYYMIPESFEAGEIRLYRAERFPERWTLVKPLIRGAPFIDASLLRHDDRWWLFTSVTGDDLLLLYHAERLEGPWQRHPQNPLVFADANIARPAGRIVAFDGRIVRYAQDDDPFYGAFVRAFEITELTPTRYAERLAHPRPVLEPGDAEWHSSRMHHLDPHRLDDGRWIACVDGFRWATVFGLHY